MKKSILCLITLLVSFSVLANEYDAQYLAWKNKQPVVQHHIKGNQISLNTATVAQLRQLQGVGEKKANLIVEYRQKHGGFKSIEELQKVKGIGIKNFQKNKASLSL